jgi:hypothetical protein
LVHQAIDVVVMPEEIGRELSGFLLLAIFGGHGLELFHQGVTNPFTSTDPISLTVGRDL